MGSLISINTDGLAKLGETIAHVTGLTAYGNKKIADAEAYATIKKAQTDIEAKVLQLKGENDIANYLIARESRKLNNTKSVVEKAQQHFIEGEKVSDEPVGVDWTSRFFNIVEDISDNELQDLWARILSGEVKQPQTYSLRTLDVLKNLSKQEAQLFSELCDFVLDDMLVTQFNNIPISKCTALADAGLITFESLKRTYTLLRDKPFSLVIGKFDCIMVNNITQEKKVMVSFYNLSRAGEELSKLVNSDKRQLLDLIGNYFKSKSGGIITSHRIIEWNGTEYRYITTPLKTF